MQVDTPFNDRSVLEPLSLRRAFRVLDKFYQDLIRRTVFAFHNEKIAPTLGKTQNRIKDSIEISRYKLAIALNALRFTFRKRGKKHYVKETQHSLSDRCDLLTVPRRYFFCGSFMFFFFLVFAMYLCASVCMCFVVTSWERSDHLVLVFGV